VPDFNALKEMYTSIEALINRKAVLSAKVLESGGIAAVISEMSFGNDVGIQVDANLEIKELFRGMPGGIILELKDGTSLSSHSHYKRIGRLLEEPSIYVEGIRIGLQELKKSWQEPLEKIFPTFVNNENAHVETISSTQGRSFNYNHSKNIRPKVFIPVFPGTNCEYDSAKAFETAGAMTDVFVFRNRNEMDVEYSLRIMTKKIEEAQIIMIPGGFSGGDEPEGSGKFIATVFRNPLISDAVMRLLKKRDGLMLGVCNGFQALIKLGLLPYGEIRELTEACPTLTYNTIGRHVSCMVRTRIASNCSPWLQNVEVGDFHMVPVAHGEGRFIADEVMLQRLKDNGQIATQYVDPLGEATMDTRYNPNGSMLAIEGITSHDGRILGKMAHSERKGKHVIINIPGCKDQKIFEAGVSYFC